jgi:hypothetical protein
MTFPSTTETSIQSDIRPPPGRTGHLPIQSQHFWISHPDMHDANHISLVATTLRLNKLSLSAKTAKLCSYAFRTQQWFKNSN